LTERDIQVPTSLLSYDVFKPAARHKFTPWQADEEKRFQAYMLEGIELLAKTDPSWDWYQRISRTCHTYEFRTRMRMLPFYFGISRHLTRYTEMTRFLVSSWNWKEKTLQLTSAEAKAEAKISLADDEFAWLFDVVSLNRNPFAFLLLSPTGKQCIAQAVGRELQWLFARCGLDGKLPYELKYNGAGEMYRNPEQFADEEHEKRLARIKAISGHSEESKAVKRYIKDLWGNAFGHGSRTYYNKNRVFPFRIEDFPVKRLNGGES
jgi:hypothetical protein